MSKSERNIIPLIIIIGSVLVPLVFILGIVVGSEIQMSTILSADSLSSWVSAIATVAIAVLTFILAKETWYLREAQIEQVNEIRKENIRPSVSVELALSKHSINLINIAITNRGKGIANNISFQFTDKLGNKFDEDNFVVDSFYKLNAFKKGMNTLGIGQELNSFLFSFFDAGNDIFDCYIQLEIVFFDISGNRYINKLVFDFSEYKGITGVGSEPLYQMAKDLEKIQKVYSSFSGSKRLNVNTFDGSDRAEEKAIVEEKIERMKRSREKSC